MRRPLTTIALAVILGALCGAGGIAVGVASRPTVDVGEARRIAAEEVADAQVDEVRTDVDTTGEQVLGLILHRDEVDANITAIAARLDAIEHRLTELDRYLRAQRIRPASYTTASTSTGGHNLPSTLRRIGGCESTWNPSGPLVWTADNPSPKSTASGAFGVLDGTWHSWARSYGTGVAAARFTRALHAPPDVQVAVVTAAYDDLGTRPWTASSACWA